jgi:hypothetical protein
MHDSVSKHPQGHLCAQHYHYAIDESGYQVLFGVRVRAGIVRDNVTDPNLLADKLIVQRYCDFPENVL